MRYEDMPKGRNKDRCVRCGKRYNFADKALSKAKVPYDLLCLAEVTTSGYMTHGNVKLCDECMVELLMWLDRKTESNSEKPNNCEHITEDGVTCAKYPACDDCLDNPLNKVKGSERLVKGNDEPTISKMEQVDKDINVRSKDCETCKHYKLACELFSEICKYEPTTQTETQNSNLTFEKRTMRDCYNCKRYETEGECVECHYEPKDEPQTERSE